MIRFATYTRTGRSKPAIKVTAGAYAGALTGQCCVTLRQVETDPFGPLPPLVGYLSMEASDLARMLQAYLNDATAEHAEHMRAALLAVLDSP